MSLQELSEQEVFRRESLNKLRAMGIEPFPAQLFPVDTLSQESRIYRRQRGLSRW